MDCKIKQNITNTIYIALELTHFALHNIFEFIDVYFDISLLFGGLRRRMG